MAQALHGKVAVITGAGRGIGRAIALAYASAGASVVCGARSRTEIDETVSMIMAAGGKATACPVRRHQWIQSARSSALRGRRPRYAGATVPHHHPPGAG